MIDLKGGFSFSSCEEGKSAKAPSESTGVLISPNPPAAKENFLSKNFISARVRKSKSAILGFVLGAVSFSVVPLPPELLFTMFSYIL